MGLDQDVGSSSATFKSWGFSITAYGYTVSPGGDTPLGLYFKNRGADESGLGIVGPSDHELQGIGGAPAQYIQLDLGSLIASGKFTGGAIEIGSVQDFSSDEFNIYGSSVKGQIGTKIAGTFDYQSDQVFLNLPDFGDYRYISIGAVAGDVLPIAFQANCIPEMGAFFPIVGLIVALTCTQLLRRRRVSQARSVSEV